MNLMQCGVMLNQQPYIHMQQPRYTELSTLSRHFCNIKHGISRNAELTWIFFFLLRIHRGFKLWKQVLKTYFAYVPFVTVSISNLRKTEPYCIINLKPAHFHVVLTEMKAPLHFIICLNQKWIFSYTSAMFALSIFFVGHRCLLLLYSIWQEHKLKQLIVHRIQCCYLEFWAFPPEIQ